MVWLDILFYFLQIFGEVAWLPLASSVCCLEVRCHFDSWCLYVTFPSLWSIHLNVLKFNSVVARCESVFFHSSGNFNDPSVWQLMFSGFEIFLHDFIYDFLFFSVFPSFFSVFFLHYFDVGCLGLVPWLSLFFFLISSSEIFSTLFSNSSMNFSFPIAHF